MNQFDNRQIACLQPLANHNVCLYYSFYANTFPIAYHYNLLLNEHFKNEKNKENFIQELIRHHDWSDGFPSKSLQENYQLFEIKKAIGRAKEWQLPEKINIFYTSRIEYKTKEYKPLNPYAKIKSYFRKKIIKDVEGIEIMDFTQYTPRFIFLNNNLFTQQFSVSEDKKQEGKKRITIDNANFKFYEEIKKDYEILSQVIDKAENQGISKFIIYTDIVNEAKDILEEYNISEKKGNAVFYNDKDLNSIISDSNKNGSFTLDLYFYSAPIIFRFLDRIEKFIPILFDIDKQAEGIKTIACIHYNKKSHKQESIEIIKKALTQYHSNLFSICKKNYCSEQLNNVRLAYNKYARLIRHYSYFFTSESYANCIALHHNYNPSLIKKEEEKQEQEDVKKENKPQRIHIHFGAGKLGIGLILPLFKEAKSENVQIIVTQKMKDEWVKKIHLDLDYIELENTIGWNLKLQLLNENNLNKISNNQDSFILYYDLKKLKRILENAHSISYSLNNVGAQKELLTLFSEIKFKNKVFIFPFENGPHQDTPFENKDHNPFANNKAIYVKLKPDRVCLDRIFYQQNRVSVKCEGHVEVVFKASEQLRKIFFDDFPTDGLVFRPKQEAYEFFENRKKYLVNELHFVIAVYGYHFLLTNKITTHWEDQYVTIILSAIASDSRYKIPIDTFIRLEILRLIVQHDNDIIRKEYLLKKADPEMIREHLWNYAQDAIVRFNKSGEDKITRVFNINDISAIEKKYHDIINEIKSFLSENKNKIKEVQITDIGTLLEYEEFIKDIEQKIEEICERRLEILNSHINNSKEDEWEKTKELKRFESRIKKLTNKNKNKLFVFDVDGTLFKAKEVFLPAIKSVLENNSIKNIPEEELMDKVGKSYSEFMEWQEKLTLKQSYKDFKESLQKAELFNIQKFGKLFEGVEEMLTELKDKNFNLAICTNARKEYINVVIEKFNLKRFFEKENIVYPEKFEEKNPARIDKIDMIRYLKEQIRPLIGYVVGDRIHDMEAAQENDFNFIGANYGYFPKEIQNCSCLINSITEIGMLLK